MTTVILLLLCLSLATDTFAGQDHRSVFRRVPSESGLSQNSISAILQDRRGFLWVGTSEGLNRYDGYQFVTYRHDPRDPGSLSDNKVRTLFEDRGGTLWVGTSSGANRLDERTGRFVRPVMGNGSSSALDFTVWQIVEDSAGTMWLATSAGVCRLERDRVRGRLYPTPRPALRLHEERSGTLWMFASSTTEPHRYDSKSDRFVPAPLTNPPGAAALLNWTSLHESRNGTLWLASSRWAGHARSGTSAREPRRRRPRVQCDLGRLAWGAVVRRCECPNIVFTLATTAYDLHQGNYKTAAVNVALGVVPFGSLFKAAFRGVRQVGTTIVNLAPEAVTEVMPIANLVPEAITETALVVDNVATAVATLPDAITLAGRAIRAGGSREAVDLLLSQGDELKKMYEALKKLYLQGFTSASDFVPYLSKTVGQPGWQAKLCALASAHHVFTGQFSDNSVFATMLEVAVHLTLRGSGYRCSPGGADPFF